MDYRIAEDEIPYTGKELRSGWLREQTGFTGSAALGFVGPCRVENEDLVDLEDARAGAWIRAESMAHIIVEHTEVDLALAVLRQRLLVCLLCEELVAHGVDVRRDGDDVYCGDRKLTVSIAAPAESSCLIHLGINVDPVGAPVPAIGLDELDIEPRQLLGKLLGRYEREISSCRRAAGKVRSVP